MHIAFSELVLSYVEDIPFLLSLDLRNSKSGLCALSLGASAGHEQWWAQWERLPLTQPHPHSLLPEGLVQLSRRMG